ncbi:MAG TPA: hypothetical protein VE974_06075 [Thermoanaerobaculia bacterium]|nr:hypothetical protein [Thermoanaerobaculia bacterium]
MTQDEYNQAKTNGEIKQDPASRPDALKAVTQDRSFTLEDFIPAIFPLLSPARITATVPTFTPKSYLDCIQLYDDGSSRALYLFVGDAWRAVSLGGASGAVGRSYLTTNQAFNTGVITKVAFDANDYADGLTWEGGSNRFVCVTAGKYLVTSTLQWSSPTANFSYIARLYKNGSRFSESAFVPGTTAASASNTHSDIVALTTDDYVEMYAVQSSGGTNNLVAGTEASYITLTRLS